MGTRAASKQRLARIKEAKAAGSLGPFAHAKSADSGLTPPRARAKQDSSAFAERRGTESELGLKRGKRGGYTGE